MRGKDKVFILLFATMIIFSVSIFIEYNKKKENPVAVGGDEEDGI